MVSINGCDPFDPVFRSSHHFGQTHSKPKEPPVKVLAGFCDFLMNLVTFVRPLVFFLVFLCLCFLVLSSSFPRVFLWVLMVLCADRWFNSYAMCCPKRSFGAFSAIAFEQTRFFSWGGGAARQYSLSPAPKRFLDVSKTLQHQ